MNNERLQSKGSHENVFIGYFLYKSSSYEKHRLLAPDPNERTANPKQKSVLEFFKGNGDISFFAIWANIDILSNLFLIIYENKKREKGVIFYDFSFIRKRKIYI